MKIVLYLLIVLINLSLYCACIREGWKAKDRPIKKKYEKGPHKFHRYSGSLNHPAQIGSSWVQLGFVIGLITSLIYIWASKASWLPNEMSFLMACFLFLVPPLALTIIVSVYQTEYFKTYPDLFQYYCWKMYCLGASEKDFLEETEISTVRSPEGDSVFGYDSLSKGGIQYEIKDGAEIEILAKKGKTAGCVVLEDETVCWIDMEYLTGNSWNPEKKK